MVVRHRESTGNSLEPILTPLGAIGMSLGPLEGIVPKSEFWLEIALFQGLRKALNAGFAFHFEMATGAKPIYINPSCDMLLCLESPLVSISMIQSGIMGYLYPIKVALHSGDGVRFVPLEKYSSSVAGRFHVYEWAYPVPNTIYFNAMVSVSVCRGVFGDFMRLASVTFGAGLSPQFDLNM